MLFKERQCTMQTIIFNIINYPLLAVGIFLIIYGYCQPLKSSNNQLKKLVKFWSPIFTLSSITLTAISIYLAPNQREALKYSLYVSTPLLLSITVLTCIVYLAKRDRIYSFIIEGLSICILCNNIFRLY